MGSVASGREGRFCHFFKEALLEICEVVADLAVAEDSLQRRCRWLAEPKLRKAGGSWTSAYAALPLRRDSLRRAF